MVNTKPQRGSSWWAGGKVPPAGTSKSPVAGSVGLPLWLAACLIGRTDSNKAKTEKGCFRCGTNQCQQGRGAFCLFLHLAEWHPLQNLQLALATGLQSCIIDVCCLHGPQPRRCGVPWHVDPRGKCNRQMFGRRLVDGWPLVTWSVSLGPSRHLKNPVGTRGKNTESGCYTQQVTPSSSDLSLFT